MWIEITSLMSNDAINVPHWLMMPCQRKGYIIHTAIILQFDPFYDRHMQYSRGGGLIFCRLSREAQNACQKHRNCVRVWVHPCGTCFLLCVLSICVWTFSLISVCACYWFISTQHLSVKHKVYKNPALYLISPAHRQTHIHTLAVLPMLQWKSSGTEPNVSLLSLHPETHTYTLRTW